MNILAVVWWVIVVAGLVPTSWFLWRFRPKWPIRSPSLIINGLVTVIWLTYVRSALVVVARGWIPPFPDTASTVISLTLGAAVDGLLILMLVKFLAYRRQWQAGDRNGHEEDAGHESAG